MKFSQEIKSKSSGIFNFTKKYNKHLGYGVKIWKYLRKGKNSRPSVDSANCFRLFSEIQHFSSVLTESVCLSPLVNITICGNLGFLTYFIIACTLGCSKILTNGLKMSCFQQQYMPVSNIWLLSLSLSLSCIDATEKTLYPYLLRMWVTTIMLCCASVHMTALHQYHHKNTTNAIYLCRLPQLDCNKNTTRIQHTSMQYFKQVPRIHPNTLVNHFLCYCQKSHSPKQSWMFI